MSFSSKLRRPVEVVLSIAEEMALRAVGASVEVPTKAIFIVGPPRSGTTLLYQVLASRYKVVFINNFMARFVTAPVLTYLVSRLFPQDKPTNSFDSYYGQTKGWASPHEAGQFWYRWFPRGEDIYVGAGELSPRQQRSLFRQVNGLQQVNNLPILFKNTYNAMRLAALSETFPNAIFLISHRQPIDIMQSILRARLNSPGGKHTWWSLPPREIATIRKLPYWEQIAQQVFCIYQQIERDRVTLGAGRFLDVSYRELCESPGKVLKTVEEFSEKHSISLLETGPVPKPFTYSTGCRIDVIDYERFEAQVSLLWQDFK